MKFAAAFLMLVLATCTGQKNVALNDSDADFNAKADSTETMEPNANRAEKESDQSGEKGMTFVASEWYSGIEQPETIIIKDAKSLQKFYSKINRMRKPGLPVPYIDFSQEMVVVRCSGAVDNGSIPQLYLKDETKEALVLGIRENKTVSNSSAVITPFSVYRIPLTEKEVVLKE